MLNRQKMLMLMLNMSSGGASSRIRLTKLSFLISKEAPERGGAAFYEFLPYQHGPYSFCLGQEIGALVREGLVDESGSTHWSLSPHAIEGLGRLPNALQMDVFSIMNRYGDMTLDDLVQSVYSRYPWYTVESVELSKRAYARRYADPGIYTIGYEGLTVDGFFNTLMQCGMRRLVDVRSNPYSRKYGFKKRDLEHFCQLFDLDYVHLPKLGVPLQSRLNLSSEADYAELFQYYRDEVLSAHFEDLAHAGTLAQERSSVFVCVEADPARCHRSPMADAIDHRVELGVTHLGWPR